jgi:hypothetical protein
MTKIERIGNFETNSSSSHSISLDHGTKEFGCGSWKGVESIEIMGCEFGWGYEEYNDAYHKASYLLVDNPSEEKRILRIIKNFTGAKEVTFDLGDGYIDHQSCGTSENVMESDDEIRNFIFNDNCTLIIDNDNH